MKQDKKHQIQMGLLFAALVFAILAPVVWAVFTVLKWFE